MLKKKPGRTMVETGLYFASLIVNIFLGWLVAKINTANLNLAEYGQYSFFIIILFYSNTFFSFGLFESTSRLLAVTPPLQERKQLLGTGLLISCIFCVLYFLFFLVLAVFSDRLFEVKISDLCFRYAALAALLLIYSYYLLALRGSGQIKLLSVLTILPRIFYLGLLIALMLLDRFSLVRSLNMFFIGLALALIWSTFVLRPSFASFQKYVGSLWSDLKSYGVHVYLSNIWNETLLYADKFIISIFLPVQSLAYYYLGYALTIPLSHFSNALATTMFNRFASQDRIDSRVTRVNILFVVSSVSIFIVLRRFIIVSLFSAEYLPTVDLMLPLALAFGFSGLSKPFTLFLMARGAGKTVRNISIAVPTINIVLGILIIPRFEIMGAAWVQTVVLFCDLLLFFLAYRKFTGVRSA